MINILLNFFLIIPATLLLILLVLLFIFLLLLLFFVLSLLSAALFLIVFTLGLEFFNNMMTPLAKIAAVGTSRTIISEEPIFTALAALCIGPWSFLGLFHHVDLELLCNLIELLLGLQSSLFSDDLLLFLALLFV